MNNVYVSTTGNDSIGSGLEAAPFRTVSKGMAEVADGGTVWLADGVYTGTTGLHTSDGYLLISAARSNSGKNIKIRAINPGLASLVSSSNYLISITTNNAGWTIEILDCLLDGVAVAYLTWNANIGGAIKLTRCAGLADKLIIRATGTLADTKTQYRECELIDCDFEAVTTTGRLFDLRAIRYVNVDNCAFDSAYDADATPVVYITDTAYGYYRFVNNSGNFKRRFLSSAASAFVAYMLEIRDNGFEVGNVVDAAYDYFVYLDNEITHIDISGNDLQADITAKYIRFIGLCHIATPCYNPVLTGNLMHCTRAGYYGTGIEVYQGVIGATILDNVITGFEHGIDSRGSYLNVQRNIVKCSNPVRTYALRYSTINYNTLIAVDGHAPGRCLVFGRYHFTPWSGANAESQFTATEFTDGAAWDVTGVTAAMIAERNVLAVVNDNNATLDILYFGLVTGTDTNKLTVDEWIDAATGLAVASLPAGTYYVRAVRFGEGNTVLYNIMDSSNASYNLNFDFNPRADENYIDFNCYVAGSNSLSNLGAPRYPVCADLSELQARHAVVQKLYRGNDANSIEVNPLLDGNYRPANSTVRQLGAGAVSVGPASGSGLFVQTG